MKSSILSHDISLENAPRQLADLMTECLSFKVEDRPLFSTILTYLEKGKETMTGISQDDYSYMPQQKIIPSDYEPVPPQSLSEYQKPPSSHPPPYGLPLKMMYDDMHRL